MPILPNTLAVPETCNGPVEVAPKLAVVADIVPAVTVPVALTVVTLAVFAETKVAAS